MSHDDEEEERRPKRPRDGKLILTITNWGLSNNYKNNSRYKFRLDFFRT